MSSTPFQIPAYPKPLSISQARVDLPPEEFRQRLRSHLLSHPGLTLAQVARELKTSRQYVSQSVGRLNRPNCSSPLFMRLAPKTAAAKLKLDELAVKVQAGESAERAAAQLQISLPAAIRLGFRSRQFHPAHGTSARAQHCRCYRCRKAKGIALSRGPRSGPAKRAEIMDWCAWSCPFSGETLTQSQIGRLTGVAQAMVSRISRGAYQ